MNLDKQHAVLEEIFEYLLENGRKDLVDKYNNVTKPKETEKICTARRQWRCCKCRKTIDKGTKYFNRTYVANSMFITKRFCLDCMNQPKKEIKQVQSKMKFINGD